MKGNPFIQGNQDAVTEYINLGMEISYLGFISVLSDYKEVCKFVYFCSPFELSIIKVASYPVFIGLGTG